MKSFIFILAVSVAMVYVVNCGSNCGIGNDECGGCSSYKRLFVNIDGKWYYPKVCCKSCSQYFRSGYYNGRPYCTCDFDRIGGDCWKGAVCNTCGHGYTGRINGVPVCCQNCEKSGLYLSATNCTCLHNGP